MASRHAIERVKRASERPQILEGLASAHLHVIADRRVSHIQFGDVVTLRSLDVPAFASESNSSESHAKRPLQKRGPEESVWARCSGAALNNAGLRILAGLWSRREGRTDGHIVATVPGVKK